MKSIYIVIGLLLCFVYTNALTICDNYRCVDTDENLTYPTRDTCITMKQMVIDNTMSSSEMQKCVKHNIQIEDLNLLKVKNQLNLLITEYNKTNDISIINKYAQQIDKIYK